MIDPVEEVSRRARLLAKRIERGEERALERLRATPGSPCVATEAQHKHCLAVIARELGFRSYDHAARVLRGDPGEEDRGVFMHTYGGFINTWFVDYDEAREANEREGHFLVGYKRQYVVVERGYIEALGLDPDDRDFAAMGSDFVRPRDPEARARLYLKRLRAFPDEQA